MWPVGLMAFRIGTIIDPDEQIEWIRAGGFDGVGFHAASGLPGEWRGIDPSDADAKRRAELRDKLAGFTFREIHAPFDAELAAGSLAKVLADLLPVLDFGGDLGADIVTVHADPSCMDDDTWPMTIQALAQSARRNGLRIGLEITKGFERLIDGLPEQVGLTLDVGHLYHHGGAPLTPYGSPGALVRKIEKRLYHIHLHDCDKSGVDHIAPGLGSVDFDDLFDALADVSYRGALNLELNTDRVPPEAKREALEWVRKRTARYAG